MRVPHPRCANQLESRLQAGLLENLHRIDTMIVEEVAKIGRNIITGLRVRLASSTGGA